MSDKKIEKIEHSVAVEEFNRFCESWEIDNETADMNEEDKKGFEDLRRKVVNAIKRGRLVFVNDEFIYTISKTKKYEGDSVTMKLPEGAGYMETDRFKDREGIHKIYAIIASMTGKTSAYYANMNAIDLRPFIGVVNLFLAE